jgi:thiol-disulfide isomerase/thioredoxin
MRIPAASLISGMLTSLLLAVPAFAQKQHKLSDWKIGRVLFGEKLSEADMKDKVVVVENWGVYCPPCVAALPHLAALEKKHREQGLIIIGAESQDSSKGEIKPLIEKAGVEYIITDGAEGPIEVNGIPHAFVFDRSGMLVFNGNPNGRGFEEAVTKALGQAAPAPSSPPAPGPMPTARKSVPPSNPPTPPTSPSSWMAARK